MRLWSIHPLYLDQKGLVALWREGLLAKKVLEGKTRGYKNHPQLERFKQARDPVKAINLYLFYVYEEAKRRGYRFNANKIHVVNEKIKIPIKRGQALFELNHLLKKVKARDRGWYAILKKVKGPVKLNPIFYRTNGGIEKWEKI
jgi:hypothetical protein